MARISEVSRNPGFRMQKNLILLNRSLWKSETEIRNALAAIVDDYNGPSGNAGGFMHIAVNDTVSAKHTFTTGMTIKNTSSTTPGYGQALSINSYASGTVGATGISGNAYGTSGMAATVSVVGCDFSVYSTVTMSRAIGCAMRVSGSGSVDMTYGDWTGADMYAYGVGSGASAFGVRGFVGDVRGTIGLGACFYGYIPGSGIGTITTGSVLYCADNASDAAYASYFDYIYCEPHVGASATLGNIRMAGGDWNDGHLRLSDTGHIWRDSTNSIIRLKGDAAPTATTSGIGFNNTTTAIGATTTVTLGKTGGSGPGTAAQNKWLKIWVDATAYYVPLWV